MCLGTPDIEVPNYAEDGPVELRNSALDDERGRLAMLRANRTGIGALTVPGGSPEDALGFDARGTQSLASAPIASGGIVGGANVGLLPYGVGRARSGVSQSGSGGRTTIDGPASTYGGGPGSSPDGRTTLPLDQYPNLRNLSPRARQEFDGLAGEQEQVEYLRNVNHSTGLNLFDVPIDEGSVNRSRPGRGAGQSGSARRWSSVNRYLSEDSPQYQAFTGGGDLSEWEIPEPERVRGRAPNGNRRIRGMETSDNDG